MEGSDQDTLLKYVVKLALRYLLLQHRSYGNRPGKMEAGNFSKVIKDWMRVQKEKRIYELGSLPPFLLVFIREIEPIKHKWNQRRSGGDNVVGSCRSLRPGLVSFLHWSGKEKLWARLDAKTPCPLDSMWAPYDLYTHHELLSS